MAQSSEKTEISVACKDLGGFSLDSAQPCLKIWLFPISAQLGSPKSLGFLLQGWETEARGGSSAAAPYLLSSLITGLRDGRVP